jgi:hypothetical protein
MPQVATTNVSSLTITTLSSNGQSSVFQHIQQTGHASTKETSDMDTVRELEKKKKGKKKR